MRAPVLGEALALYIEVYFNMSEGDMYQSKPSLRPGGEELGEGNEGKEFEDWPDKARVAWTRWDLDSGTSQSGRVVGTSEYSCWSGQWGWTGTGPLRKTNPIDQVEDNSHGNAKLLEIKASIIVNIGEVPDPLELVISQLAVF